ncbi:MAG TPA: hypothetical protein VN285_13270, partial [Candidatus Deferrimicrobium sp.]|nr:hypothetical protein [Candidatus Deferrimicrobium sp.]
GKGFLLGILVSLLVGWAADLAASDPDSPVKTFHERHQAGVRIGLWANAGETPPHTDSAGSYETSFKSAAFYFEGFFAFRLARYAMLELSAGVVNRGSVTFREAGGTNVGNVLVHPILLQLKVYPLAGGLSRPQPYFLAGGGLYYGRRSVQFTTSSQVSYFGLAEQSGTNFNYVVGAGLDWPLSRTIGLEAGAKYMPIEFSKGLQTIRSYDGVAIVVGIKYLYASHEEGRK